jgi:predicted ATPase
VLDALFNSFNTYILENQRDLLRYAPDVTSAVSFLSDM